MPAGVDLRVTVTASGPNIGGEVARPLPFGMAWPSGGGCLIATRLQHRASRGAPLLAGAQTQRGQVQSDAKRASELRTCLTSDLGWLNNHLARAQSRSALQSPPLLPRPDPKISTSPRLGRVVSPPSWRLPRMAATAAAGEAGPPLNGRSAVPSSRADGWPITHRCDALAR
eukprot:356524-Chlamydomonas_euryale.AAC.4